VLKVGIIPSVMPLPVQLFLRGVFVSLMGWHVIYVFVSDVFCICTGYLLQFRQAIIFNFPFLE
jgi:hypothetical protein